VETVIRRVLVVHPDVAVQQHLMSAIAAAPGGWAAEACHDLRTALARLADTSFDAVVADATIRSLDGLTVLDEAARQQPRAVRFVFSTSGGPALLLRATGPAHQHLDAASEATSAFARLARTLALADLLADERLARLVARLSTIPSLPTLYLAINTELGRDIVSGRRIGDLIARDPGMTAKVLQLVNSPYFGFRVSVGDPVQAVQLLGLETVRALVLSLHVFSRLDDRTVRRFRLGRAWRHSLAAAACARLIAQEAGVPPQQLPDAFTAALLHDVGKLLLATSLPNDYQSACRLAEEEHLSHHEAERRTFDVSHAEVGGYLLGLWGLPESIVEAVAWHHRPAASLPESLGIVGAVHAADAIEHDLHPDAAISHQGADENYIARLGHAWRYPAWKAACQDAWGEGHGSGLAARM
jgi:HD-like signal output (HDOD) protein